MQQASVAREPGYSDCREQGVTKIGEQQELAQVGDQAAETNTLYRVFASCSKFLPQSHACWRFGLVLPLFAKLLRLVAKYLWDCLRVSMCIHD